MAEIVKVRQGELTPISGDYLLVTQVNGKFVAILAKAGTASIVPPSPFETQAGAFIAASRLADTHQIPLIYVDLSD